MATLNTDLVTEHAMAAAGRVPRCVRTMVVDDTPGLLEMFSAVLSTDPRVNLVATADNGLAAIAVAETEHPDLIFMDIHMPTMNGLTAAMHIKRRVPATKIILMSADEDPDVAMAAMDCGADGFLPKSRWATYGWHLYRLFLSAK